MRFPTQFFPLLVFRAVCTHPCATEPTLPPPPPPPPPPPRWKLHKGPSRGSVLVGQSAPSGFVKARNERGCSSDVEEKTTNFYENKEVEEYWKKVRREAKRPTGDEDARKTRTRRNANVTVQSRIEAMRNKINHKHFQSTLDEVLKDPPEREERSDDVRGEDAICEGEFEETYERDIEEKEEEEDEDEEDENVRKMMEEFETVAEQSGTRRRRRQLRRRRETRKRKRKRTTNNHRGKRGTFPPTYEYGSFIPKMNEKSRLDVIEEEAERAVKNRYEEDDGVVAARRRG